MYSVITPTNPICLLEIHTQPLLAGNEWWERVKRHLKKTEELIISPNVPGLNGNEDV